MLGSWMNLFKLQKPRKSESVGSVQHVATTSLNDTTKRRSSSPHTTTLCPLASPPPITVTVLAPTKQDSVNAKSGDLIINEKLLTSGSASASAHPLHTPPHAYNQLTNPSSSASKFDFASTNEIIDTESGKFCTPSPRRVHIESTSASESDFTSANENVRKHVHTPPMLALQRQATDESAFGGATEPSNHQHDSEHVWAGGLKAQARARTASGGDTTLTLPTPGYYGWPPSPSSASVSSAQFRSKFSLEDFIIVRVLGRGSYAKVVLAEEINTGRLYAIKSILKSRILQEQDTSWPITERNVLIQARSPFIVHIYGSFQTEERLCFVLEYVSGGDMCFFLQRKQRLTERQAQFYAVEITLALWFLHQRGIIYRDLKTDNVMVDSDGHVKLTDFGLARDGMLPGMTTSTFCGTPNYMAPEVLKGNDYTVAVDWWALGVLLFELLVGRSPFRHAQTEEQLFEAIKSHEIVFPGILSNNATSLLQGLLERDPAKRIGYRVGENCKGGLQREGQVVLPCEEGSETGGIYDIFYHPFFAGIDWEQANCRLLKPPYRPKMAGRADTTHFDPEFTSEDLAFTPDEAASFLKNKHMDSDFDGFSYIEDPDDMEPTASFTFTSGTVSSTTSYIVCA